LSLLPRFWRAQGVERQQLKWLAYAAVLMGAFVIGIAVLRYRLYEIDRLINRTLVYGTLTALLGLIYAVGVFGWGTC
jgi:hypothetical protein